MNTNKLKLLFAAVILNFLFLPFKASAELACWNDGAIANSNGAPVIKNPAEFNQDYAAAAAEPVNLLTGNFDYTKTDLKIPSRGIPTVFARFYNSQDAYDGPLGFGWSHTFNISLTETSDNTNTYVLKKTPSGHKDNFTLKPDGTYEPPKGCYDTLTKTSEKFILIQKNGTVFEFNLSGRLQSITDRNGNNIVLTYDQNNFLVNIRDTADRNISIDYNLSKKISKITDFSGREIKYSYDASLNLTAVTLPAVLDYPGGTTESYTYDANHHLLTVKDAIGSEFLINRYDQYNRVNWQKYNEAAFSFNYDSGSHVTTVTDRNGNITTWALNSDGTASSKHIDTFTTRYFYDENKNVKKITYPKGNSVDYEYDTKGNVTKITRNPFEDSSKDPIVTEMTYEPRFNQLKIVKDPLGNITTYIYDYENPLYLADRGNLMKIIYPQVNEQNIETNFTYNSFGQIEIVTDPNGNITKYEYGPAAGNLIKVTNGFGSLNYAAEMSYDVLGNINSIKDPKGNISTFEYDGRNNRTKIIQPAPFNYVTIFKYDQNDNLTEARKQLDVTWQVTKYTYNLIDKPVSVEDPLGNKTYFTYDKNDNKASLKDANGNITLYEYNSRDLLSKVTDALVGVTLYFYDDNGNLAYLKDAKNNETHYEYDDFDRLIAAVYADGLREEYTYDAASNMRTKALPKLDVISYDYDALNRLSLKTYPDTKTVSYVYDQGSRLKQVTDQNGAINYDYDAVNRITQVNYPNSKAVAYEYDANSNRTKLTYPDTSFITYEYDQLNRLQEIKGQAGLNIAAYTYDDLSRRKELDYANNTKALYDYDIANRLLSQVNKTNAGAVISSFSYSYDNTANKLSMDTPAGLHQYSYDKIYQIKNADYPIGYSFSDTQFNYDSLGNRSSVIAGVQAAYSANNLNQYTQIGPSPLTYDSNGNLINDSVNSYTYDYENRLISADKPGTAAAYKYDSFGRRVEKEANSSISRFIYDGDQVIAEYDGAGVLIKKYIYSNIIDEPIAMVFGVNTYYYHRDSLNSITEITNNTGAVIEKYSYDVFGNTIIKDASDNIITVSSIGNPYGYTGREFDSETNLYYYRARYYSPAIGRFLQRDLIGYQDSNNLYAYCSNNPVNFVDPLGLCGKKNDLQELWEYWGLLGNAFVTGEWGPVWQSWEHRLSEINSNEFALQMAIGFSGGVKFVGKQTIVIGHLKDTMIAKDWPGHNVLDMKKWTMKGNIKWLDSAIRRGDDIYLATSNPRAGSVFVQELKYLIWRGFKRVGDYMRRLSE
ncbi:MAG: RHS repeat-associated core domain-containing protein [Candidatus Omnitrophota bacterium]